MKERLSDGWKEWILGLKNNFEICFQSLPQMSYCNNVCMRWIICRYKRWECSRRDSRAWEHGPLLCLGHLHVEFSQTCSGELCRWSKKEVFTSCYTITLLHRFRKVFLTLLGVTNSAFKKSPLSEKLLSYLEISSFSAVLTISLMALFTSVLKFRISLWVLKVWTLFL